MSLPYISYTSSNIRFILAPLIFANPSHRRTLTSSSRGAARTASELSKPNALSNERLAADGFLLFVFYERIVRTKASKTEGTSPQSGPKEDFFEFCGLSRFPISFDGRMVYSYTHLGSDVKT